MVFAVLLAMLAGVANTFPDQLPHEEISSQTILYICSVAILFLFLALIFAHKKQIKKSYFAFFFALYSGSFFAIYSGQKVLQVQNSKQFLILLLIPAIAYLPASGVLVLVFLTLLLIDGSMYLLELNPMSSLVPLVSFHATLFIILAVAFFVQKQIQILLDDAKKEGQLRQMGLLAGVVSHEINNPLNILTSALRLMTLHVEKAGPDVDKELTTYLKYFEQGVDRITDVISSTYSLIRPNAHNDLPGMANLREICEELSTYCQAFAELYGVNVQLPGGVPEKFIEVKKGECIQIIVNLIKNSCIANSGVEGACVWVDVVLDDKFILFRVIDKGVGMPSEVIEDLSKPFKPQKGNGLGLGLSVSMALAEKNCAKLSAVREGENTVVELKINALDLPGYLNPTDVKKWKSDRYSHHFQLSDEVILTSIRRQIKGKVNRGNFKEILASQEGLLKKDRYHYLLMTNGAEISLDVKFYLSSRELRRRFLSSAIIGRSASARQLFYFISKILKLPYPVRIFKSADDAYLWIEEIGNK